MRISQTNSPCGCAQDSAGNYALRLCSGRTMRVGDTGRKMRISIRKNGVLAAPDLTGWTASAQLFFTTELFAALDADADETTMFVRRARAGEVDTWPTYGDIIDVQSSDPERVTVVAPSSELGAGAFTVVRAASPKAHPDATTVRVLRATLDVALSHEMATDEHDDSQYVLHAWADIDFASDPRSTASPGQFYVQITLVSPELEQVTLPQAGGFAVRVLPV